MKRSIIVTGLLALALAFSPVVTGAAIAKTPKAEKSMEENGEKKMTKKAHKTSKKARHAKKSAEMAQ